jgi:GNAT superfamily N-acetyltransferase
MQGRISIKQLADINDVRILESEFAKWYPWYTKNDYYEKCLEENQLGSRVTLLAFYDEDLAGCCSLLYKSDYPYFIKHSIPEINNLNVFPQYRKKGVATRIIDELEGIASRTSKVVGLGVGLYKDYGNAQRMYCKRGYVLDGNGITYQNVEVEPGKQVIIDDELLLYLVKELV